MSEFLMIAMGLAAAFFIPAGIYLLVMRLLCGKI